MKNNKVRKCYVDAVEISLEDGHSITISYGPLNRNRESNKVIVTNEKGKVKIKAFGRSRFLLKMGHKKIKGGK